MAAEADFDTVTLGGDGVIHEVVNGLKTSLYSSSAWHQFLWVPKRLCTHVLGMADQRSRRCFCCGS